MLLIINILFAGIPAWQKRYKYTKLCVRFLTENRKCSVK